MRDISPLPGFFSEDPLFTYEDDPHQSGLGLDERMKLDRLYFPRHRKRLMEKFDMIFFQDPYIDHFNSRQFGDLYYAFTEGGMPSLWSFGPAYGQVIQGSILGDVLPISDHVGYFHKSWYASFRKERDPVFLPFVPLGMEHVVGEAYSRMDPRQGADIWADFRPLNLPWIVSWRPGGKNAGLTWVFADEFNTYWWGVDMGARGANPFALDMMANLVLYSLDRNLISDVHARREARYRISNFRAQKMLVISMLEWADMFGANTFALSEELNDLDSNLIAAVDGYLNEDYDASISCMDKVSMGLTEITGRAVQLKDEALFWVFISEWMVVTGGSAIGGVALWSLMVRRRMYKAAGATRIRPIY